MIDGPNEYKLSTPIFRVILRFEKRFIFLHNLWDTEPIRRTLNWFRSFKTIFYQNSRKNLSVLMDILQRQ